VTCSFVGSVITEEKDNFYLISSFTPFRLLLPTNTITTTKKELTFLLLPHHPLLFFSPYDWQIVSAKLKRAPPTSFAGISRR
jgi:hypothetical protein